MHLTYAYSLGLYVAWDVNILLTYVLFTLTIDKMRRRRDSLVRRVAWRWRDGVN